ncbi:hypothetical protein RIF29_40115 [Crotalaria pallida]|uniref:Disease resistance N-terminal domain-containing protein n=1 Tax=Crotalaria pallida TaxID=3830 RepID=A0AAN9E456_CROPI
MDLSESSLSCRAESILEKLLSSSTVEQVSLDIGVSGDLQEFKEALSSLKDRLLVADYRPQLHPDLLEWPWMLKQVLSDAENMLDEIHCQSSSSLGGGKQKWLKPLGSSFITKVGSFFFSSSNPFLFRNPPKLATQIKELTKRVQHCAAEKFDVGTFPYDIIDKDVRGREIDKETIIEKLLMEHHDYDSHCDDDDDESLSVLPIVGMRGLGDKWTACGMQCLSQI